MPHRAIREYGNRGPSNRGMPHDGPEVRVPDREDPFIIEDTIFVKVNLIFEGDHFSKESGVTITLHVSYFI